MQEDNNPSKFPLPSWQPLRLAPRSFFRSQATSSVQRCFAKTTASPWNLIPSSLEMRSSSALSISGLRIVMCSNLSVPPRGWQISQSRIPRSSSRSGRSQYRRRDSGSYPTAVPVLRLTRPYPFRPEAATHISPLPWHVPREAQTHPHQALSFPTEVRQVNQPRVNLQPSIKILQINRYSFSNRRKHKHILEGIAPHIEPCDERDQLAFVDARLQKPPDVSFVSFKRAGRYHGDERSIGHAKAGAIRTSSILKGNTSSV